VASAEEYVGAVHSLVEEQQMGVAGAIVGVTTGFVCVAVGLMGAVAVWLSRWTWLLGRRVWWLSR
jgi:hypothetical protein